MLNLKKALEAGDTAIQALGKSIAHLKNVNDNDPGNKDAVRMLVNEVSDQSTELLTNWNELHSQAQLMVEQREEKRQEKTDPTPPAPVVPVTPPAPETPVATAPATPAVIPPLAPATPPAPAVATAPATPAAPKPAA